MLKETKTLCQLYGIKPARSKGQNFLINQKVYQEIIKIAELSKDSQVLEVGPGLGFLTFALASKAKQVIAVELDDRLAEVLSSRLQTEAVDNVQVINANVLDFPYLLELPRDFTKSPYQVVANLPYNITSVFLRKFLEADWKPQSLVLLLQKEVAERMTAKPGAMSLLALSVQYYSQPQIMLKVKAKDFWPQPKVDSAVIKLELKAVKDLPLPEEKTRLFFRLARIGFSARRKMLKNNLASGLHQEQSVVEDKLKQAGLSVKVRAQDLSLSEWLKVFGALQEFVV